MSIKYLEEVPLAVGAGAIYPYSDELLKKLARTTKYGEPYSLGRVIGSGAQKRILVPRRMAPPGGADLRLPGAHYKFKSTFKPRYAEQLRIIIETVELLKANHNFMLSAPPGVGKTWMSTEVIARIGLKTLVVVTKEDILDQWAMALHKCLGLGILVRQHRSDGTMHDHVQFANGLGIIQADNVKVGGCGVVLAFVNSIAKNDRYPVSIFNDFGLVIWDECHRIGADFFSQSAFRVPARLRLGISATTDRSDGKTDVLEAHIGPVMVESTLAAEDVKIVYTKSTWQCPMHYVTKKDGEKRLEPIPHNAGKCGHIIKMLAGHHGRNKQLCAFIAAAYKKGRVTLFQTDLLDHINTIYSLLPSFGIPVTDIAAYVGGMSTEEREKSKLKPIILSTYMMTKEATDIPRVDTLVMGTPKADVEQIIGRIRRSHPDKLAPLAFDLIDASSPVFSGYWDARRRWYRSQGFVLEQPARVVKAVAP